LKYQYDIKLLEIRDEYVSAYFSYTKKITHIYVKATIRTIIKGNKYFYQYKTVYNNEMFDIMFKNFKDINIKFKTEDKKLTTLMQDTVENNIAKYVYKKMKGL